MSAGRCLARIRHALALYLAVVAHQNAVRGFRHVGPILVAVFAVALFLVQNKRPAAPSGLFDLTHGIAGNRRLGAPSADRVPNLQPYRSRSTIGPAKTNEGTIFAPRLCRC